LSEGIRVKLRRKRREGVGKNWNVRTEDHTKGSGSNERCTRGGSKEAERRVLRHKPLERKDVSGIMPVNKFKRKKNRGTTSYRVKTINT